MSKICLINCIDYRYDYLVSVYYNAIGEQSNYYNATAAGASLPISYQNYCCKYGGGCTCDSKNTNCTLKKALLTNFEISQSLSNTKIIDLINHQDCGAINAFLPDSGYPKTLGANNAKEIQIQQRILVLAREELLKKYPNITVTMKLIDINGYVGQLINGVWKVVYKGSGTNPKGIWWGK